MDPLADQAQARIDQVEARLIALQDLGLDTTALQSQLRFARKLVDDGRFDDVEVLCDELITMAGSLAQGTSPSSEGILPGTEAHFDPMSAVIQHPGAPLNPKSRPQAPIIGGQERSAQGGGSERKAVEVKLGTLLDQIGSVVDQAIRERLPEPSTGIDEERLAAVIEAALDRHEPDTGRLRQMVATALSERQATQEQQLAERLERLEERLATRPAVEEAVTRRIQQAVQNSFERHDMTSMEVLCDRIALAVEHSFLKQRVDRDQQFASRISETIADAFRDLRLEDEDRIAHSVAEAVEASLARQAPRTIQQLSDQVVGAIASAMRASGADQEALTAKLERAVSGALGDHLPTGAFQITARVQRAVSDSFAIQQEETGPDLGERIQAAIDRSLAAAAPSTELREEHLSALRDQLQAQLEGAAEHLERSLGQAIAANASEVQDEIADMLRQLRERSDAEAISAIGQRVGRMVAEHRPAGDKHVAALGPARAQMRKALAEGLGPASQVYEISGSDLARCADPQHLVEAGVAEDIESLIDSLLGTVNDEIVEQFTRHMTRRLLVSSAPAESPMPANQPDADAIDEDDDDAAMDDISVLRQDEEEGALEQSDVLHELASDDSRQTVSVPKEDLAAALMAELDEGEQAMSHPSVVLGDSNADVNTDAETTYDAALARINEHDTDRDAGMARSDPPVDETSRVARDLLYELTAASMPESLLQGLVGSESTTGRVASGVHRQSGAHRPEGGQARAAAAPLQDLSMLSGGDDTSALVREALARGERGFSVSSASAPHADPVGDSLADHKPPSSSHRFEPSPATDSEDALSSSQLQVMIGEALHAGRDQQQHLSAEIRSEVRRQITLLDEEMGATRRMDPPSDPTMLRHQLRALLPEMLQDETIKQHLFAVLAYEMIVNPGIVGELAGIRHYIDERIAHHAASPAMEPADQTP